MSNFPTSNFKLQTSRRVDLRERAFTLVEMIIAMMIFTIVAVVALSALVKIISANRKAQTLQTSITNLNFALESMSREMRVGRNYNCGTGPFNSYQLTSSLACNGLVNSVNGSYIAFNSTKVDSPSNPQCNLIFVYSFVYKSSSDSYDLQKGKQTGCSTAPSSYDSIVDPNVTIKSYYLNVTSTSPSNPYPLATIRISGYAGVKEREKTYFDVQTSVSARVPD